MLELSQQFDHQDVKNGYSLSSKVHEELQRKCNLSFRGQVTQQNFKFLLALACSVHSNLFTNIPELKRCLKEKDLHAPVQEMSLKVFFEFFAFPVANYLSRHIDDIGPHHY